MTDVEFMQLVNHVRDQFGMSKLWVSPSNLYKHFMSVPLQAGMHAVDDLFAQGLKYAPTPSEVRAAAGKYVDAGELECAHPHLAHVRPSDPGAEPWLFNRSGPGALLCAKCGTDRGTCACEDCRTDPLFSPYPHSREGDAA